MTRKIILLVALILGSLFTYGQNVGSSPEYIKALTSQWKGERFADGRPKVSDAILDRLKDISVEESWSALKNKGYLNQFEGEWMVLKPGEVMTGRVITAQYMPLRPDLQTYVKEQGKKENRAQQGASNSWPIDIMTNGDVYVADGYGKMDEGTLIGDNLGTSIYTRSERGVIFYGSLRDEEGLGQIEGFNAWFKGSNPSYLNQMMLTSINAPIRVGHAIVLPGDVVLAKKYGVVFIPAHLVEDLVVTAEITALRDKFGIQRLKEKKYLAGQIDSEWTEEIRKDFLNWLENYSDALPMTKKELDDYLKDRNY